MPSKSPAQARLMAAAAHTPGGYGGVPQSVGKDFNQADKGTGIRKRKATVSRTRTMGRVSSSAAQKNKVPHLDTGQTPTDRAARGE